MVFLLPCVLPSHTTPPYVFLSKESMWHFCGREVLFIASCDLFLNLKTIWFSDFPDFRYFLLKFTETKEKIFQGDPGYDVFNKRLVYCPTSLPAPNTLWIIFFVRNTNSLSLLTSNRVGIELKSAACTGLHRGKTITHTTIQITRTHTLKIYIGGGCTGIINMW